MRQELFFFFSPPPAAHDLDISVCRYKDNRYPENTERMVIKNNSGLEAEIQFHFQNDTQAITYMLDPPSVTLQPDQEQVTCLLSLQIAP